MPAAQARIPVTDEGLLRGDGVFEVVRLYGGRPFALDEHLERMTRSAQRLRLAFDAEAVRADSQALLAAAHAGDDQLRLVVTRGGLRLGLIEPLKAHSDTVALATVTFAPTRILDQIKSLSYAGNMLATRLAQEQGADEALLVTPHGRVLEGPTSTIFCALDGDEVLVTPPLSDHVLDSITRRRVIGLTGARERPLTLDELLGAREACLASTTREVQAVATVDGRDLALAPGPLTRTAQDAFGAAVR